MNPDAPEPFRPFKTFSCDVFDSQLEALEEIAKRDGITVEQVIWRGNRSGDTKRDQSEQLSRRLVTSMKHEKTSNQCSAQSDGMEATAKKASH
jgi:hypothetical protein